MTRPADHEEPSGRPLLRVVRGDATPEEIAALVAVLVSARAADGEAPRPRRSARNSWSDRSRQLRRPLSPAPGAWRSSSLPS
jgi:Acyl-CoA carboxylase epsilon subunit